jgi:succinyl-CoA synthetase beta subunit
MIGYKLVTHQTGPDGVEVKQVMLAEAKDLIKETYVAVLLDRNIGGACLVVSPQGGVDIEQLAESSPENIKRFPLTTNEDSSFSKAAEFLFPIESENVRKQARDQLERLYTLFKSVDATMIEINPFGLTPQEEVLCFDAKLEFDENAAFRQSEIFKLSENEGEEAESKIAKDHGLNYIKMDGNIGCLVNGAGLAMATMDLISLKGGKPANFLDVGGGATSAQIKVALEILLRDPQVSSILINIFGGIMRCDVIAAGILAATKEIVLNKPLIVRLSGTNADLGMKMLKESDLKMETCSYAEEAAEAAVKLSKI